MGEASDYPIKARTSRESPLRSPSSRALAVSRFILNCVLLARRRRFDSKKWDEYVHEWPNRDCVGEGTKTNLAP